MAALSRRAAVEPEPPAPDPDGIDFLMGLADAAQRSGKLDTARSVLVVVLERDPTRYDAHARLAEITGLAERTPSLSDRAAIELAEVHPYDPWVLLRAGEAQERSGDAAAAIETFERAVWLGDVDPPSAVAAAERLAVLSERWRSERLVRVHAYADESVRAETGWQFRLRTVLLSVSNALSGALQVRFAPASIGSFSTEGVPPDLESIHQAFTRATASPPAGGLLAAFTGRPAPSDRAESKQGIAEFLGRRLTVRLPHGAVQSRTLAHEILHLYGAVHVDAALDSLMNPAGGSLKLDPLSQRTVRAMRRRSFDTGDFAQDVLPRIDVAETIDAYLAVLAANESFRAMGFPDHIDPQQVERVDVHLADVSRKLASLMVSDGRPAEALSFLEIAVYLYGSDTERGRETAELAASLRRSLLERR